MSVSSTGRLRPAQPSSPKLMPPQGACDSHAHLFGPYDHFPLSIAPSYEPPLAPFEDYLAMLDTVGIFRGILVQPTGYQTDCRALVDATWRSRGRVKGIGVATADISDADLAHMDEFGVCGLRFIEVPDPSGKGRYRGSVGFEHLEKLAPRLHELGWMVQLWAPADEIVKASNMLAKLDIPIVLDHMGNVPALRGASDPAFDFLLGLLADGLIWIKLPICRISTDFPNYSDARPMFDALIKTNAERLIWGSDWPHVGLMEKTPDVGHLIDLFDLWLGDTDLRQKIFSTNAEILFGFTAA